MNNRQKPFLILHIFVERGIRSELKRTAPKKTTLYILLVLLSYAFRVFVEYSQAIKMLIGIATIMLLSLNPSFSCWCNSTCVTFKMHQHSYLLKLQRLFLLFTLVVYNKKYELYWKRMIRSNRFNRLINLYRICYPVIRIDTFFARRSFKSSIIYCKEVTKKKHLETQYWQVFTTRVILIIFVNLSENHNNDNNNNNIARYGGVSLHVWQKIDFPVSSSGWL